MADGGALLLGFGLEHGDVMAGEADVPPFDCKVVDLVSLLDKTDFRSLLPR
jgi:hypothetical protein